jgi:hypothetical protein
MNELLPKHSATNESDGKTVKPVQLGNKFSSKFLLTQNKLNKSRKYDHIRKYEKKPCTIIVKTTFL